MLDFFLDAIMKKMDNLSQQLGTQIYLCPTSTFSSCTSPMYDLISNYTQVLKQIIQSSNYLFSLSFYCFFKVLKGIFFL